MSLLRIFLILSVLFNFGALFYLLHINKKLSEAIKEKEKIKQAKLDNLKNELTEADKQKISLEVENHRLAMYKEIRQVAAECEQKKSELIGLDEKVKLQQQQYEQAKSVYDEALTQKSQQIESETNLYYLTAKHRVNEDLDRDKTSAFESLQEYLDWIFTKKEEAINEIDEIKTLLEDYRKCRESINEAIMREKEIQEKESFYKIVLTENDLQDMKMLQNIASSMRNKNAIPKLIWETILQRPTTEMIKRVLNGKTMSGIYKITYQKTGEAYIGQSTDIKTRWQNHAKTSIGLDAAATSTFHNRLAIDGIENYTWELLEEVPKDKLREREKYWIEFYQTNKFGLNMKSGG